MDLKQILPYKPLKVLFKHFFPNRTLKKFFFILQGQRLIAGRIKGLD